MIKNSGIVNNISCSLKLIISSILLISFTCFAEIDSTEVYLNKTRILLTKDNDYNLAYTIGKIGLKYISKKNNLNHKAKMLRYLGFSCSRSEKYQEALSFFTDAIILNKKLDDQKQLARNYLSTGAVYYKQELNNKAISEYKEALEVARKSKNYKVQSAALNNIGASYKYLGQYDLAIKHLLLALELAKEYNYKFDEAQALGNLGACYQVLGKYKLSEKYLLRDLALKEESQKTRDIINTLINLGKNYSLQEEKEKALNTYKRALELAESKGSSKQKAVIYSNIGVIYSGQRKYEEALLYFKKAYEINLSKSLIKGIINTRINIASVRIKQNKLKIAEDLILEAQELALKHDLKQEQKAVFQIFTTLYKMKKDYKKAIGYMEKKQALADSIMNLELAKKIEEMQIRFETSEKEHQIKDLLTKNEIEKLEADNRQKNYYLIIFFLILSLLVFTFIYYRRKSRDREQKILLNQKLLRSQMNPHFIFNALNSINTFIFGNKPKEASIFLSRFAKLMRNILESSRNEYITLEKEIETLKCYLELEKLRLSAKFSYDIITDDILDIEEIEIPSMLIQPFVENAFKHGFKQNIKGSEIRIEFKLVSENLLQCYIIDNGVGIDSSLKRAGHNSYSTSIIDERLQILNKKKDQVKLKIYDRKVENEQGTKVSLIIPLDF